MVLLVVFLLCKQKTSCEMGIRDWSSDGCSSDRGDRTTVGAAARRYDAWRREVLGNRAAAWACRRLTAHASSVWHRRDTINRLTVGFLWRILLSSSQSSELTTLTNHSVPTLGDLEIAVLEDLWRFGPSAPKAVYARIGQSQYGTTASREKEG